MGTIERILRSMGLFLGELNDMYVFTDYPNISLLKFFIGLAIFVLLLSVALGDKPRKDDE